MVKWRVKCLCIKRERIHFECKHGSAVKKARPSLKEYIVNVIVDSKGLACPMPVIKLKKALTQNTAKESVFLLALTDDGGLKDIPAFCQQQKLEWALLQTQPFIEFKVWRKGSLEEGGG